VPLAGARKPGLTPPLARRGQGMALRNLDPLQFAIAHASFRAAAILVVAGFGPPRPARPPAPPHARTPQHGQGSVPRRRHGGAAAVSRPGGA
jgi:hypothetical protein